MSSNAEEMQAQNYNQGSQRRFLSKRDFKDLFRYEENERDKKTLKKDWKKLDKAHKKEVEFKHIIGKSSQSASKND